MCRVLIYLGQPVLIDHLLYQPDSSLVKQTFMPRKLAMLNLAGFGMMAWDRTSFQPDKPFVYQSTELPVFDRNLKALAEKIKIDCLLAHVRGVAYSTKPMVSKQNTHPFCFEGFKLALAHNGDLHRIDEMKPTLAQHIRPAIAKLICGTTDSEWIYALLMSQLEDPYRRPETAELKAAVEQTLRILGEVRAQHHIHTSSSVNLFISDGETLAAVRYCFDFGCYRNEHPGQVHETNFTFLSLWYTVGREFGYHEEEWKMIGGSDSADSLIVASEPLTADATTWLEVPEYSMLIAHRGGERPTMDIHYLGI